jgi:salicylate hydroxylase
LLALALTPYPDITVDIYEAATKFEEIGAGLAIWGRGVAALKKLGLEETLRSIAPGTNERERHREALQPKALIQCQMQNLS